MSILPTRFIPRGTAVCGYKYITWSMVICTRYLAIDLNIQFLNTILPGESLMHDNLYHG